MTLFDRLRGGSSDPIATAISANPATKTRSVAESSSVSSSRLLANDSENIDGYHYDPIDAARFWQGLTARVDECDRLIHQLCDLRNDTSEHRTDLLAVRKTMAPNNLVGDIAYLKIAIAEVERPRCAPSFTPRQDRTPL